jgi:hypothetical protein
MIVVGFFLKIFLSGFKIFFFFFISQLTTKALSWIAHLLPVSIVRNSVLSCVLLFQEMS